MESLFGLAVIAGMVLLRIVVPILVMVLLVWGLRRLNARWEAEAREERISRQQQQPAARVLDRDPSPSIPAGS